MLHVFAQITSNRSLDFSYQKTKFYFKELIKHLTTVSRLPSTVLLFQLCLYKLWVVLIIGKVTFNKVCSVELKSNLNSF